MSDMIMFLAFAAVFGVVMALICSANSRHEDVLDRRAMYNEVLRMGTARFEARLRSCKTLEEKNALYLNWEEIDKEDAARDLAMAKEIFGIVA